jgi:hypothetical protein
MRKVFGLLSAMALATISFVSCNKSSDVASNDAVSSEVRTMVKNAGFNPNWVQPHEDGFLIEDDIFLTKDELTEMGTNYGPELVVANSEHYRTSSLVTGLPRTLTVRLNITGALFSNALNIALARYNNLNLRIRFQRVTTGTSNIPIGSFNQGPQGGGIVLGRSNGFPRNGNPAPGFNLNINSQAYGNPNVSVNHLATVMAHEIGHTIGFRHTDYANRAFSCGGQAVNEGSAGVGAIYIPGTPAASNADPTSWMLACIGYPTQNRPFNNNDVTALNFVY